MRIKTLLTLTATIQVGLLTGCASVRDAGIAHYSVKPFVVDQQTHQLACCEVDVVNGKEIGSLEAHIVKGSDGSYVVDLKEQSVKAFEGQALAANVTSQSVAEAAKVGAAVALAPVLPALLPAAGAALASPGIGAAALGAGAVLVAPKVLSTVPPVSPPSPASAP